MSIPYQFHDSLVLSDEGGGGWQKEIERRGKLTTKHSSTLYNIYICIHVHYFTPLKTPFSFSHSLFWKKNEEEKNHSRTWQSQFLFGWDEKELSRWREVVEDDTWRSSTTTNSYGNSIPEIWVLKYHEKRCRDLPHVLEDGKDTFFGPEQSHWSGPIFPFFQVSSFTLSAKKVFYLINLSFYRKFDFFLWERKFNFS